METAKSKGKRGIFWIAVGILTVILAIPIGSYAGHAFIGLNDHSNVLSPESGVQYIYNASGSGIAFASVNGTTAYYMPLNETVSYILTNLSEAELNDYSVSEISITFGSATTVNESIGFGTNSSNFQPFLNASLFNATQQNIAVQPQYLTGNQSSYLMIRFSGPSSSYSFSVTVYGNSQYSYLGPFAGEQVAYLISGIIIIAAAFLESPWIDIGITRREAGKSASRKGGR